MDILVTIGKAMAIIMLFTFEIYMVVSLTLMTIDIIETNKTKAKLKKELMNCFEDLKQLSEEVRAEQETIDNKEEKE